MKITELMINDWVLDTFNKPLRVRDVITFDNMYSAKRYVNGDMLEGGGAYCQKEENIEPIPITTEILEKNGFEHKHDGELIKRPCQYWIINVGGGSVKVKINRNALLFNILGVPFCEGYYKPSFNAYIQYVHEFQHVLRLCGLNELADNFII